MTARNRWIISMAVVILIAAALEVFIAARYFPWRFHADLFSWTSVLAVVLSEWLPARTSKSVFHFRMAAQIPLFAACGWFPLIAILIVIALLKDILEFVRNRQPLLSMNRWITALLAPCMMAVFVRVAFGEMAPPIAVPLFVLWIASLGIYWMIPLLLAWIYRNENSMHPWSASRGWFLVLYGLDAWMTLTGLLEIHASGPWGVRTSAIELSLLSIIVAAYIDASVRRARSEACAALAGRLSTLHSLPDFVNELFQTVGDTFSADAAALWIIGEDGYLTAAFTHAYYKLGQPLVTEYRHGSTRVPWGLGLVGFCASSRETTVVLSPAQKHQYDGATDASSIQSAIAAPVILGEEVYAVLGVYHCGAVGVYGNRESESMAAIATQFGSMLGNLWRFEQTRQQTEIDELTGLYNYRYFDMALQAAVERDTDHRPVSLLIIDIDHFKQINDKYGHIAGNQVLRKLSEMIMDLVRDGDIVARYGGEEFTVLLPGLNTDGAHVVAERIREHVEAAQFEVDDSLSMVGVSGGVLSGVSAHKPGNSRSRKHKLRVTLSIGVACYPESADSALALIRHADRAMYIGSKQRGRNRVSAYGR